MEICGFCANAWQAGMKEQLKLFHSEVRAKQMTQSVGYVVTIVKLSLR